MAAKTQIDLRYLLATTDLRAGQAFAEAMMFAIDGPHEDFATFAEPYRQQAQTGMVERLELDPAAAGVLAEVVEDFAQYERQFDAEAERANLATWCEWLADDLRRVSHGHPTLHPPLADKDVRG